MKKKIVLMKNVQFNFDTVRILDDGVEMSDFSETDRVQLSSVIEVDFPELDNEVVINSEVAIIDKQITKVNADAHAALTALESRKQELLAICSDK